MSGVVTVIGLYIGLYTNVWPRFSIEPPSAIVDPLAQNIFPLPFKLINAGYFPIYNVSVACWPNLFWPMTEEEKSKIKSKIPTRFTMFEVGVRQSIFTTPKLRAHERRSFICDVWDRNHRSPINLSAAELDMEVSFRPISFIPWTVTSRFFFDTNKTEDGKLHWVEPSLDQPANRMPKEGEKFFYGRRPPIIPNRSKVE